MILNTITAVSGPEIKSRGASKRKSMGAISARSKGFVVGDRQSQLTLKATDKRNDDAGNLPDLLRGQVTGNK
jgi:hypothetical protein